MELVWAASLNFALISSAPGWTAIALSIPLVAMGLDVGWLLVVTLGALTSVLIRRALKPSPCRPPQITENKKWAIAALSLAVFLPAVVWPWPLRFVVACVGQVMLVMVSYAMAGSRAGLHLWWMMLTLLVLAVVGAIGRLELVLVLGVGWLEVIALVAASMMEDVPRNHSPSSDVSTATADDDDDALL